MSLERGHRPTNAEDRPRRGARTVRRRAVGVAGVALLIVVAACGGSDDDASGDAEAGTPVTKPASTEALATTDAVPTTTPEPDTTEAADDGSLPAAEWADSMTTAWTAYLTAQVAGLTEFEEARLQGVHFFDVTHAQASTELEALEAYATALDVEADDPALDASADPMRAVVDQQAALVRTLRELGEEDADRVRQEIDDSIAANSGPLPSTPWGDAFAASANDELSALEESACFDLQDAIEGAGLGLVDCAGSSIDFPPIGDLLEPGVHEFAVFEPGLTLELAQPTIVLEAADFVEVSDPESPVSAKFVAIDEVVDPASLSNPDSQTTIPIPDDLGPWLAEFPVTVLDESTVDTATGPARYWDLQIDAERAAELAPGSFFIELARYAVNDSFDSYSLIGGPPVADEHFIIVDWRRGEDRTLVYGIENLDQPLFEWIQTMLSSAG